jgi:hypothetical protein
MTSTMDISHPDGASLLDIPADRPELLFPADRAGIRQTWRRLCGAWHPDRNRDSRAGWVFAHLQALHRAALERLDGGVWDSGRELTVTTLAGTCYRLRYLSRLETALGPCLIGREVMAWLLPAERADIARRGFDLIGCLPFADTAMRESMAGHLPAPRKLLETRDFVVVVLGKQADFVSLADLRRFLGGSIDPRHVAWIASGLLDIACYLEWADLCHLAIAPDQCLVSPHNHGVALAGGWWFATRAGTALECLPARSARVAPPDVLHHRVADRRLDALLIRHSALDLLGDAAADAPAAMRDYLALPGSGSAIRDYHDWQRALWTCFGERRFTELAVSPEDVYAMSSS